MILQPGSIPVCVLTAGVPEFSLDRLFFVDLYELFQQDGLRRLTHESIAVDLCQGFIPRESITRLLSGARGTLSPTATFCVIGSILLRSPIPLSQSRFRARPASLPADDRQAILQLLYEYGVQCATGECCKAAKDPLPKSHQAALVHAV